MNIVNTLWAERYRPKELSEMVLSDQHRLKFENFIRDRDIANLLLYGPPGSGKTCIAQILCSSKGVLKNTRENLLHINGSGKDTRGIGFVESTIEPFLKIPPDDIDKNKIIFIDESDNLTRDAMLSLKVIMETYSEYGRFIFACNYISKIEEAIISRTQSYEFRQMPIEYIKTFTEKILRSESIKYTEEDLTYICESFYPDIRRTINTLQKNSLSGELIIDRKATLTSEKHITSLILEIISFIKNNQRNKINSIVPNIIQILGEKDLEYKRIYEDLFYRKEIPPMCKIVINEFSNKHQGCLVPSMHFMAMIFEMISAMNKYMTSIGKG